MVKIIILILHLQMFKKLLTSEIKTEEICFHKWFKPQCYGQYEIILIEKATYGRMELGKCLSSDDILSGDKFFGCHADVTPILNQKCFKKSSCEITISDEVLIKDGDVRPCFKGLFMYLKVEYLCVINQSFNNEQCIIPVISEAKQLLMTLDIDKSKSLSKSCGNELKPWILEAPSGQYVDIQLLKHNFIRTTSHTLKCQNGGINIGYILTDDIINVEFKKNYDNSKANFIRKNNNKNISICIDSNESLTRLSNKLTKTSKLELILFKEIMSDLENNEITGNYILLKIQAIGCVDLIPPEDAWLKRLNDLATVGCYSSRQTWTLKCKGNQWQGVIGNCSISTFKLLDRGEISYSDNKSKKNASSEIQFLSIVAICGFGLALCFVIICIGWIYFKRMTTNKKQNLEKISNLNYKQNTCNYANGLINTDKSYTGFKSKTINESETLNNQDTDVADYFVLEKDVNK